MPSWFTIAKNEYLLITSGIRRFRKFIIPVLIIIPAISFLIVIQISSSVYIGYTSVELARFLLGVPNIVTTSIYPQVDVTLVIGQYVFLIGLFTPIIEGLANVLWETQTEDMDILFSSPIKPRQLFLGELAINLLPLPISLAFLSLSLIPIIIVHGYTGPLFPISFFITASLLYAAGTWIGLLLSTYLKLKSRGSYKYIDLTKAVIATGAVIITLGFFAFTSSQTTVFYIWYSPTTWASNIIYYALTGTNITPITYLGFPFYTVLTPDPITSLALLTAFLAAIFISGYILISRMKQLELLGAQTLIVKKEGRVYKFLRRLIPSKLGRITVAQLKEFSRDPDSLMRIVFVFFFPIILYFLSAIELMPNFTNTNVLGLLLAPSIAFIFILTVGTMIGQTEAAQMTIKGKGLLYAYKKVPQGVELLVRSKFVEMLIVGLPLGLASGIVFQMVLGSQSPGIQVLVPIMMFVVLVSCAISVGVYSARPVLQYGNRGHLLNSTIIGVIVSIVGSLMVLFALFPWIINVILSYNVLNGIIQFFPYLSNLILSIYSQFPIIPEAFGILAAIIIGVVAAYLSLKIGVSKLIRYE
nr:hypothetical protein [Candidatus Freyarchaeota archaeon]